jgi:hypothetical protein
VTEDQFFRKLVSDAESDFCQVTEDQFFRKLSGGKNCLAPPVSLTLLDLKITSGANSAAIQQLVKS